MLIRSMSATKHGGGGSVSVNSSMIGGLPQQNTITAAMQPNVNVSQTILPGSLNQSTVMLGGG
jgi:hypothetical protein